MASWDMSPWEGSPPASMPSTACGPGGCPFEPERPDRPGRIESRAPPGPWEPLPPWPSPLLSFAPSSPKSSGRTMRSIFQSQLKRG